MRAFIPLLASSLLLWSCGQKDNTSVVVKDKNGSVAISANGQQFVMKSGDGKGEVTVNANGQHVVMHAGEGGSAVSIDSGGVDVSSKLPAFVSVYPGARVVSLVAGNAQGGSMTLEAKAAPDAVIGFYKQNAEGAGLKQTLSANDAGNLLYGATLANRTVQVLASKDSEGTHAQVTWSGR
jgi:hypothetical protein